MKKTQGNSLNIGFCLLGELIERLRIIRSMNQITNRKRYILARKTILGKKEETLIREGAEIEITSVRLLQRYYPKDYLVPIFQSDSNITILSSMSDAAGISFSMDLVTQVMNLESGLYEKFIERVENLDKILHQGHPRQIFSRVILAGYLAPNEIESEKAKLAELLRKDPFIRIIEVTHSQYKKSPYFPLPNVQNYHISKGTLEEWRTFIHTVVKAYTQPYKLET